MIRTSVVLPTYNEIENLTLLVNRILEQPLNIHIIIVDDNSPDGTGKLADEIAAADSRITVIHRSGKLGLGTAYIAGFKRGLADGSGRIVTMDADFSHNPDYLPALVSLADHHDLTIGSRYIRGGGVVQDWGWYRKLLSHFANAFARTMLGLKAQDCTAGFRCYNREVLENINLNLIFSNGYSFLIEMLYKCQRLGYTVGEIPITFENRYQGTSKISQAEIIKAIYTVIRLSSSRLLFWRKADRYGKRAKISPS
jgi:dolichol-phosphate mannosyltransferase